MDSEQPVCPTCGQPVETVVKRHKTLGAWVPVWTPGPCRNPECASGADPAGRQETRPREPAADRRTRAQAPAPDLAPGPRATVTRDS
ncbi:hypothetical protein AB0F77_33750 [Streptomyces sp. NPDC026672]|uniref:hypothetical protein n=1 Tax=unclassified Streptomyces TaxID=2593676 RepID=UPI0033E49FB2